MKTYDVVIIGAGHNGLVAAGYLARAGLQTIVLERRASVGGTAVTEEVHPGFNCSSVFHTTGPFLPQIIKDLSLGSHGLELLHPEVRVLALSPTDGSLCLYNDVTRAMSEIKKFSNSDAASYPEFVDTFQRLGRVLKPLLTMTPPSIEKPAPGEVWNLGKLGFSFRRLAKKDAFRLLRWGPMAVADLVAEWFETEMLRATVAARGVFGAFAGPWSAGTSLGLLWQAALEGQAIPSASSVKGGLGGLTKALASAVTSKAVEIRTDAEVLRIEVNEERATKVILTTGEEFLTRAVAAATDPHTTFLKLLDPLVLDPDFTLKIGNYRTKGSVAKINLALSSLPRFSDSQHSDHATRLSGRIHIGPDIDYLERAFDAAKYGDYSPHPWLEITVPSLTDITLAPKGAHVMSVHVQFAPLALRHGDWNSRREEFADSIINTLTKYAPDLKHLIVARKIITPLDLEETYGLAGGHIMHGEQTLDQFFAFRPLIGWAQYRTPINGLYLCGAGTHPGGGITGGPGANASREIIKDFKSSVV